MYWKMITIMKLVNIQHFTQLSFFPCDENCYDLLSQLINIQYAMVNYGHHVVY